MLIFVNLVCFKSIYCSIKLQIILFQEYKKKKRERLLKKIKDKLKYNIENSSVTNKATGTKLTDLLEAISGNLKLGLVATTFCCVQYYGYY